MEGMTQIQTIDEAVEAFYDLNVGAIGEGRQRHERPHKPVMLLAVMDMIATKRADPNRVPWSQELRERFTSYFLKVRRENDQDTPENPFFHLRSEMFWQPLEMVSGIEQPLGNTPTVAQANAGVVFARLSSDLCALFLSPEYRMRLREALVSRYFPDKRLQLLPLFVDPLVDDFPETAACAEEVHEEPDHPGRSSAFRRKVLEVYDFQCAACGLRIKLPDADLTFVDGAHIIPFQESRNDHPTNGLALCKNHHWAMDRFLLVPTPDRIWKVSKKLDARRSDGERMLLELNGQPVLPPHDDAFLPDPIGLAWRAKRVFS
jgi:putative restriction endonuclease